MHAGALPQRAERATRPCASGPCRAATSTLGSCGAFCSRRAACAPWARAAARHRPTPLTSARSAPAAVNVVTALPATAGSGVPQEVASTSATGEQGSAPFVWTRHWWPLIPEHYLLPDRPNPIMLLGMPLVVWRDGSGSWRVFKDQCPHRLAPLSEGRVEADGTLSCSYHGWRFAGSGACTRIPQALDGGAEAAACASPRSCVTSYPVAINAGLLWVWPDDAPGAAAEAAATPQVVSVSLRERADDLEAAAKAAEAGGSNGADKAKPPAKLNWFMRELPYSYEVLLENLLDPAHLPFSHHGVGLLSRSNGKSMPMQPSEALQAAKAATAPPASSSSPPPTTTSTTATSAASPAIKGPMGRQGLPERWATGRPAPTVECDFLGNVAQDATLTFHAPHLVLYTYRLPSGGTLLVELFATPVAPGRARFLSVTGGGPPPPRPPGPPSLKSLPFIASAILDPVVTGHRMLNNILDGDSVFLHTQDELLRSVEARLGHAQQQQKQKQQPQEGASSQAIAAGTPASSSTSSSSSSMSVADRARTWARVYHLPTQADSMVLACRRWLEEAAGGGPFRARQQQLLGGPRAEAGAGAGARGMVRGLLGAEVESRPLVGVAGEAPTPEQRVKLLDRYNQHTRHCPDCRKRHDMWQLVSVRAKQTQAVVWLGMCISSGALGASLATAPPAADAFGSLAAAVAAAEGGWPLGLFAAAAAAYGVAGWVADVAAAQVQQFVFVDYVHAEKD